MVDPVNPDDTQVNLEQSEINTPQNEAPYDPLLDPRSPLYCGTRTPIQCAQPAIPQEPAREVTNPPVVQVEVKTVKNNVIKAGKKKKEKGKKAKVVITQKPIKRQIAFTDSTNIITDNS